MQRFITDERTGIQYELIGDYYYPCLMIEEPPTLSKYGRMRERYLREHRKAFYFTLLASGKLNEHLIQIDTSACNMADHLIKEMAARQKEYSRPLLVDATELGEKIKIDGKNQKTVLHEDEINKIINTVAKNIEEERFSKLVDISAIEKKGYSFGAGQYFEAKIEYEYLNEDEFADKMNSYQEELERLFSEGEQANKEILRVIRGLHYDL